MSSLELWLDSDVANRQSWVRTLANLARRKGVAVLAHPHVHLELCRQDRQRKGEAFDQSFIKKVLESLGIEIAGGVVFDEATAETWARWLHDRYPTEAAWKRAKLSTVRARLPDDASVSADRVPFTTDWLVALEVERREVFIAVEDKGEEWRALREGAPKRALSYEEAVAWLSAHEDAAPMRGT